MSQRTVFLRVAGLCAVCASTSVGVAQDDPFGTDDGLGAESPAKAEPAPDAPAAPPAEAPPAPAEPPATEAASEPATGGVSLTVSAEAVAGSEGASAEVKSDLDGEAAAPGKASKDRAPVVTGSHIRRPRLMHESALIIDSPLTTSESLDGVPGREGLQRRRQFGGAALPDTTAALGLGAPGTSRLSLRLQPTLILLNGRRLVNAPFAGEAGSDFVDVNQLPISLIDRVETTRGITSGLYGEGAVGGTVNYITHRDYDGLEVDLGGQVTDKFDQHEADITLTLGAGSEKTGMNAMVSYFNRQPLAAGDRDWIAEREGRVNSLTSSPASFMQLNNKEYPFPDPACQIAIDHGDAYGYELRIPGYGPPGTINLIPAEYRERYLDFFDRNSTIGVRDGAIKNNGMLERYETSTYCAGDFTSVQDLVLQDERIQTYTTFWHGFSDHTEGFGELGYYRSDNQNRTAPSFPVTRVTASATAVDPIVIPMDHADQPVESIGFAVNEDAPPEARGAGAQFLVGRVAGLHAGAGVNSRRVDVLRGVLGLRGDFQDAAEGSIAESWDWELSGLYSVADATTRVSDVLLDNLGKALSSCSATMLDTDVSSATYRTQIPSTIKHRQEAGCYNPFYSSVINSVALDPLDASNQSVTNDRGFITSDSEAGMRETPGYGLQDGGYICDPNDPKSAPCPAAFDQDGDGIPELAGTPNTKEVIDSLFGEHTTQEHRTLATADAVLRGDAVKFDGGGLSFGVGGQFRRETLRIDYDAAFNRRLYAFVFGAPDVPLASRNIGAGFAELRLRLADGLVEVQPAARIEYFDDVGTAVSPLAGLAIRPFAASASPPEALEWLLVRGHIGLGHRAPSLLQTQGEYTEFHSVEYDDSLRFVPYQMSANPDLDFEKYTTISGGAQWDYVGIHVGADFWMTQIADVIGGDNPQTLLSDCQAQYERDSVDCPEVVLLANSRTLNDLEGRFDNLAEVETNGIDGGASYTLDTKRRGLGEFGTFVVGVQGTFINSYLIKSPRALREYYRPGGGTPGLNPNGTRDYSRLSAEYEAAGYRNIENFAPPIPQLRFAVPLRWMYEGHTIGVSMRYIGAYQDDSELVIEKYGLPNLTNLAIAEGETIDAWTVFDASYGFTFGDDGWETKFTVGVINLADTPPPEAEGPLGYDIGVHDPRGRTIYARATGKF